MMVCSSPMNPSNEPPLFHRRPVPFVILVIPCLQLDSSIDGSDVTAHCAVTAAVAAMIKERKIELIVIFMIVPNQDSTY